MGTMIQGFFRSWSTWLTALAAVSLVACQPASTREPLNTSPDDKGQQSEDPETDVSPLDPTDGTSGAFGSSTSSSGSTSGGTTSGGTTSGGTTSGGTTSSYCIGGLAAGDLAITEIMVSSKSGSGDSGEWVEITSTRDCILKLGGVTISSPRGTASDTATVSDSFELAPHATFLVADTATNAAISGSLFSWNSSDVLKNDGDTITVASAGITLDTITYDATADWATGTSLEFPAGCAATLRSDVSDWVPATTTFGTSFKGTPNAANSDVACLSN
jgi:hypothetical protein